MTEAAVTEAAEAAAPTLAQKLTAELIGTAVLVFLGCGTAFATGGEVITTGLAFGLSILILAYSFGRISGGHFNPAVSVGAALAGRIAWRETGLYAAAQTVGALVGGFVLAIIALSVHLNGQHWKFGNPLGNNGFGDDYGDVHISWIGALLLEIVLTAIFLLVILATTDKRNKSTADFAPLAIGLALAAIHFVGIHLTGTSVNPARSIGVAFYSGSNAIQDLWLFVVAPLIGGAGAGLLYPILFGKDADPVAGSGLSFGAGGSSNPGFTQQWNQQQVAQPTAAQPVQQEPIIQDGWQWDPATQQWIPAQQQPVAPTDPGTPAPGEWAPHDNPGGEHTIVRPPQ